MKSLRESCSDRAIIAQIEVGIDERQKFESEFIKNYIKFYKAVYAKEEVSMTGSPIKRDPLLADLEDIDEFDKDVHDKFNKHMA